MASQPLHDACSRPGRVAVRRAGSTVWSLRGASEFADVRARGLQCRRGRFVVQLAAGTDDAPVIVGLIIGRTVGNAVARNRVRRQVRAVLRDEAPRLGGVCVVVRALPGAADLPFATISGDLRACLADLTSRRESARG